MPESGASTESEYPATLADNPPATLDTYRSEFLTTALVIAAVGLLLSLIGWTQPTSKQTMAESTTTQEMTFAYTARVSPSPAYQTREVRSPAPVFRTQANLVQVELAYDGVPATGTSEIRLSTSNGWRWTLPSASELDASTGSGTGIVDLNLDQLEKLADRGAKAAGIPGSDITVVVAAKVSSAAGDFQPELALTLSQSSLALAEDEDSLVVVDSQSGSSASTQPNSVSLLGIVSIGVWPMRIIGLLLLALGGIGWWLLRTRPTEHSAAYQAEIHRNREMVVQAESVTTTGMVIDVADLDSLVRLAKRYALMILHVTSEGKDTFYVQDESITYRWIPRSDQDTSGDDARGSDSPATGSATPALTEQQPARPSPTNPPPPESFGQGRSEPPTPPPPGGRW